MPDSQRLEMPTRTSAPDPESRGAISGLTDRLRDGGARLGVPAVLIFLIVFFSLLRPDTFATWDNASTIAQNEMVLLIIALASLLPLIVGEFDLSVGYIASITALLEAKLIGGDGWDPVLATVVVLAIGAGIGAVNALLVVGIGVNSFIATLGTGSILSGLGSYVSNNQTLFEGVPKALTKLGSGHFGRVPINVLVALVFVAAIVYVLRYTAFGRYMFATGGGRESARLAGVPTEAIRAGALVSSGFVAGCAGLLELGLVGSASTTIGPEFLLPALAACFLGTTMGENGRFNVFGTVVAIFLIAIGVTGLEQLGAPNWVEPVFNGAALVIAVSLTLIGKRIGSARNLAADTRRSGTPTEESQV
jgi:ribose transport system permease protein